MPKALESKKHLVYQVLFLCFSGLVFFLLAWPGLKGGFVLDDWPNLSALERVAGWPDIWSFTFNGASSTLGRPISYFSFALQASDWPGNPFPFKVVNAAIHYLNFIILYGIVYFIGAILGVVGARRYTLAGLTSLFLASSTNQYKRGLLHRSANDATRRNIYVVWVAHFRGLCLSRRKKGTAK